MSTEANKAIFRRFLTEVFERRNLTAADEAFAPDYIEHAGGLSDSAAAIAGFKQFVEELMAAYPDLQLTTEIHICRMANGKMAEHWGGRID